MKRTIALTLVLLVLALTAGAIVAKPVKATFTGADCAGQVCTIEATGKVGYTTCRYFAPDAYSPYGEYLGRYDEAVTTTALQPFCEAHFEERVTD